VLYPSTPSYHCPFCHEVVAVSGYNEIAVTLTTLPDGGPLRVVEVDGKEVHRCPFVRERYESVARERLQSDRRTGRGTRSALPAVREPELRLNWYGDN
jgi:hypothetical protein